MVIIFSMISKLTTANQLFQIHLNRTQKIKINLLDSTKIKYKKKRQFTVVKRNLKKVKSPCLILKNWTKFQQFKKFLKKKTNNKKYFNNSEETGKKVQQI